MPHLPPRQAAMLKIARRLQQQIRPRHTPHQYQLENLTQTIVYHSQLLSRAVNLCHAARGRNWSVAAASLHNRQVDILRRLFCHLRESEHCLAPLPAAPRPLSLREIYEDLAALEHEFDPVRIERACVSVVTDDIELEDVYLGPFRIDLHLNRLVDRCDAYAFTIVALDPHPAAGSDDVPHPHVKDGQLCAGEATVPIAQALAQGRLLDAFLAVSSVLHTYNPGSPYIALADWHAGIRCADCGSRTPEDDISYCEDCEQDYCNDCISCCDICQTSVCRSCLDEDTLSHQLVCRHCRRTCLACSRTVDSDSFDDDTELCPECHEAQEQQEEQTTEQSLPLNS